MSGREWLPRCFAAAAIAALALPANARAEERHFTSEPIDTAGNYKIIYVPILMARIGTSGGEEFPGTLARWTDLALGGVPNLPGGEARGPYRIVSLEELRDPDHPTRPPVVRV